MNLTNIKQSLKHRKNRAIVKTITWRIAGTIITGVIVYLHTGEFREAGKLTLIIALFLTIGYYLHEKLWEIES